MTNFCKISHWEHKLSGRFCYSRDTSNGEDSSGEVGKMKFRDRLIRFFYGRNGNDELGRFTSWVALIFMLISTFTVSLWKGWISNIAWGIAIAALVATFFRMLSKNIDKRRRENMVYLIYKKRVKDWFRLQKKRFQERKTHRYYRCPKCRTALRVPRGKGKIQITCRTCGEKFIKKS